MAYSVDILYSKNQDFSNPFTETEVGQPQSVELTNLDSNETYYTKAVLKNNGTVEDESTVETFATLPAGTIALTHQSSARQGGNYVVTYTYTSTYALSSSILRCGTTIAAQGVISGNTITYTVSGLTPGDAYIYDITTIDIYTETNVVTATLVMPVVNEISITSTDPSDTEVEVELAYTVDGGFYEGFVSCWSSTQDPDTDPSIQHWAFYNGATTVNCDNLTAGTTYKFRADIVLGDMTTKISSSVVTVTTSVDYTKQYFAIKNTDATNIGIVQIYTNSSNLGASIEYSTDNGSTWNTYNLVNTNAGQIYLSAGQSVMWRGTRSYTSTTNNYLYVALGGSSTSFEPSGNLFSIINSDPSTFSAMTTVGEAMFYYFFKNITKMTDFSKLATSQITEVRTNGFGQTWRGCTSIVTPPSFAGVTTVGTRGFNCTFLGCTAMTTSPNTSSLTTVGDYGLDSFLNGCASLVTPPDLSHVTSGGSRAFSATLYNCSAMTTTPSFAGITSVANNMFSGTLHGCSSITTPPVFGRIATVGDSGFSDTFGGCTSMVSAPDWRTITTVGQQAFNGTFSGCTIAEGPDLRNVTSMGSKAFYNTYYNCRSIEKVYAPSISSWDTTDFYGWLTNAPASGTIYKPANLSIPSGSSGVPSGWTTQDY